MLKETVTYIDFDGNERTEDFYFNLNRAELIKMATSKNGGIEAYIKQILASQDAEQIMNMFEKILDSSYGEKSLDGRKFMKSKEILDNFKSTEAYSDIYTRLCTDAKFAADFIDNVIDKNTLANGSTPVLVPLA